MSIGRPAPPASARGGAAPHPGPGSDTVMKDLMLRVEPPIPGLRRYARTLMRDRDAPDDLVQD